MKRKHDPIHISQAGPAFHAFIRNLYKGIQAYFPIPEVTSWAELRAIAYWKEFDADRRKLERVWEPRFEKLLKESGDQVAKAYKETQQTTAAIRVVDGRMIPALRKMMEAAVLETEREFLKRLRQSVVVRKQDDWEVVDPMDIPEMVEWNRDTMGAKITRIAQSTRDAIRDVVDRGLKEGASIFEIVGRLSADFSFSRYRAYLIARTEIISASNAATHFGIGRNVPKKGMKKTWLATGDRRTRPTHRKAGVTQKDIPYEDPFIVGGASLMFPGDGSMGAPAKEIVQCRCTSLYSVPDLPSGPAPLPPGPGPEPPTPKPTLPRLPRSPKPKPKPKPQPPQRTPSTPEARAKAVREEFMAENKALLEEIQEAEAKLKAINDSYRSMSYDDYLAKSASARKELEALQVELRMRLYEKISLMNGFEGAGQRLALEFSGSPGWEMSEKAKTAQRYLERWVQPWKDEPYKLTINEIKGRAYARPWLDAIYMDPSRGTQIFVHEIGHLLENRVPGLQQAIRDLYARRTKGESLKRLRDVTGIRGYKASEVTRVDKWADPYMGRYYGKRSVDTELTSMALQQLYENPLVLLRDPELFDTVIGFIRYRTP